ncbi:MAG: HNH endonuclease [Anaerolineales bacterium]
MKIWVGVTDNEWFEYLADIKPDEVNFWRPSGGHLRAIEYLEPFLFKLKRPHNHIAGGGFFVKSTELPLSMAWDVFQEKNGVANYEVFYDKIMGLRKRIEPNPIIGNIVITQPFFFPREQWIPVPENWSRSIQVGKTYDTSDEIGKELWNQVQIRLINMPIQESKVQFADVPKYGEGYVVHPRLGQGGFRVVVTDAYQRRCAMTGEKALPVLQASHIKPYSKSGPHLIQNGLLLRADLHILFDQGYLTVTNDYKIEASQRMKDDFDNGLEYLKLHGRELNTLPSNVNELPSQEYLAWHQDNIYR